MRPFRGMEGFDPLLSFNIGPGNERKARESGLRLEAREDHSRNAFLLHPAL
jgi:hypothetical protein